MIYSSVTHIYTLNILYTIDKTINTPYSKTNLLILNYHFSVEVNQDYARVNVNILSVECMTEIYNYSYDQQIINNVITEGKINYVMGFIYFESTAKWDWKYSRKFLIMFNLKIPHKIVWFHISDVRENFANWLTTSIFCILWIFVAMT